MKKKYDVAAFIWPAYTGKEPRTRIFWPEGMGEWQTVRDAKCIREGHNWPRKPLLGFQDEADPEVMEQQIELATKHGVNVFIYDWYWFDDRPFLEQCLNDGFLKAKNVDKMKFYIMWANHDANYTWCKHLASSDVANTLIWRGGVTFEQFQRIGRRWIEKYFGHPSYYKIDGKPILMIYDTPIFVNGLGGLENAKKAIEWLREETVKAGFPGLHLQYCPQGSNTVNASGVDGSELKVGLKEIIDTVGYDSLANYQFAHMVNMNNDYNEIFKWVRQGWENFYNNFGVPYFPHVSVGWDNSPRHTEYGKRWICTNNTPENVEKAFRAAKEFIDTHELPAPLITVNSWNEWTESSYLLPDDLYGYGYLEAIKKVFVDQE